MNTTSKSFPIMLSIAISLAVVLWMVSGLFTDSASSTPETVITDPDKLQQVRIKSMEAETITREIVISASTAANRVLEIRAEAEGTVVALGAERGAAVTEGTEIARLDMRDRAARLSEAKALVAQRELEFSGIEDLRKRQFTTDVQIAEAKAKLESAKAAVARIELEIANTHIKAPFDAVLQERNLELGDFVRVGDTAAALVDLDPIIVRGEINEREIADMATDGKGFAVLVDGTRLEGQLRYLAPQADRGTRTFSVELEVPNPNNEIRAGLTAEMRLFADVVKVHNISAALLSLADDGVVGAKVVDASNTVRFFPVEIVGNNEDGMQVSGLPDSVRLITVGQGFVLDGQKVEPVDMGDIRE